MSLFAGMIRTDSGGDVLDGSATHDLRRALSRGGDDVRVFSAPGVHLAYVDIGIFDSSGWFEEDDVGVTVIAGHPYFSHCPRSTTRADQVRAVHEALQTQSAEAVLTECRGTFLLAHATPSRRALLLAGDRLGGRPLYYAEVGGILYFAGALRVLESVTVLPKTMAVRSVVEQSAFGFPLADRTPYSEISNLEGAHLLDASPSGVERRRYRPVEVAPSVESVAEATGPAYEVFLDAIGVRLPSSHAPSPVALLSGGMDSRSVVAGLMENQVSPLTVTLGMRGRQDDAYSRRFAEAAGVEHRFFPAGEADWGQGILQRVHTLLQAPAARSFPPGPLWSGDGGSVRVGGVYVDPPLIQALARGDLRTAARAITETRGLPKRIFRPDVRRRLDEWLTGSVTEELERLRVPAADAWAMRFFMENDQRRHLHLLYENIDVWRYELQLPFLDGRFLDLLATFPTRLMLGHRFYNAWAQHFPAAYRAVPWQSYRGHEPCPVVDDAPLPDQWSATRRETFRRSRRARRSATHAALAGDLPGEVLSPLRVWAAIGADFFRVRPMRYVFETVDHFAAAERTSGGDIDWPTLPSA